jgi:hypothetical protein
MTEKELTEADRRRIRSQIILTFILGTLVALGLVLLLIIGFGTAYVLGVKPAQGFSSRVWMVVACISMLIPLLAANNILKMIDILQGKKLVIATSEYRIEKRKEGTFLVSVSPPLTIEIYDNIVPLLRQSALLNIELSKLSKTVLFISYDHENLMEKVESEEEG